MTGEFVWSIGKCVHGTSVYNLHGFNGEKNIVLCCTINRVYYNLVVIHLKINILQSKILTV